ELPRIDYLFERKAASDRLGIPLKMLDQAVSEAREELAPAGAAPELSQQDFKLQIALETLDNQLRVWAGDHGMSLAYAGGSWRTYQNGHWRVTDELFRERLDRELHKISPSVGLVFAEKVAMIYRHLQSSPNFEIDVSELDRKP